jgi:hypothetical protein
VLTAIPSPEAVELVRTALQQAELDKLDPASVGAVAYILKIWLRELPTVG